MFDKDDYDKELNTLVRSVCEFRTVTSTSNDRYQDYIDFATNQGEGSLLYNILLPIGVGVGAIVFYMLAVKLVAN